MYITGSSSFSFFLFFFPPLRHRPCPTTPTAEKENGTWVFDNEAAGPVSTRKIYVLVYVVGRDEFFPRIFLTRFSPRIKRKGSDATSFLPRLLSTRSPAHFVSSLFFPRFFLPLFSLRFVLRLHFSSPLLFPSLSSLRTSLATATAQ